MAEIKDYKTKQRELILGFLRDNPSANPSANEIYAALADGGAAVGRTTVYRALDKLAARGEVLVFPAQDKNGVRYQLRTGECAQDDHIHLKCDCCGQVIHLDCGLVQSFTAHLREAHGFAADRGKSIIYGRCGDCVGQEGNDAAR